MTDLGTLGGSSSALYINSTLPSHAARILSYLPLSKGMTI